MTKFGIDGQSNAYETGNIDIYISYFFQLISLVAINSIVPFSPVKRHLSAMSIDQRKNAVYMLATAVAPITVYPPIYTPFNVKPINKHPSTLPLFRTLCT